MALELEGSMAVMRVDHSSASAISQSRRVLEEGKIEYMVKIRELTMLYTGYWVLGIWYSV